METIRLFATLLPLSVSSGINLYATILTAGIAIRFGWISGTPAGLDVLGSWPVIVLAGIFFLLEMLADKIPYIDNLWDVVHTVIRPLGASLLGFAALGQADPLVMVIAAMFAGSIALVSHGGKAGSRVAMNIVSPAENISNTIVSAAEDIGAGVLTFVALKYPYYALAIGIVVLILIAIFVPMMLRWAWFLVTGFFVWLKSLFKKIINSEQSSDLLPADHQALLLPHRTELSIRCKAQNIRGANGVSGYLSITDGKLFFTYDSFSKTKMWQASVSDIVTTSVKKDWLMDALFLHTQDAKGKLQKATFVVLKDRSILLKRMVDNFPLNGGSIK
jgi:hypothetical protein